MSKTSYRILDLSIFTLISITLEVINIVVFKLFDTQYYTLSFIICFGVIAIYRWNFFGLITPVISGIAGVITRSALGGNVTVNFVLAQSVGYLGLLVCLLFFFKKDKRKIMNNTIYMLLYYISGYLAVEVIKSLCQIGNASFYEAFALYMAGDLLNLLFNGVVFVIALKQKNFVVDMNCYLEDINSKSSEALLRKEVSDYYSLEELANKDEVSDIALLEGGMLDEDDLKKLEKDRRKFENNLSKFDKENEEYEDYLKEKKGE